MSKEVFRNAGIISEGFNNTKSETRPSNLLSERERESLTTNLRIQRRVLFIGAHPDDVELGCGGTIIRHIEKGDNVFILILSKGENGQNGRRINRINESIKGLCSVGVKKSNIKILNFSDTNFSKEKDAIFQEIENLCKLKKIDRVYTHTNKESHQDHVTIHEETLRAARNISDILVYESNAYTSPYFSPNFFIIISKIINQKINLIKNHCSQSGKEYIKIKNIKALAKVRGHQSRMGEYAEGFEVIRIVIK